MAHTVDRTDNAVVLVVFLLVRAVLLWIIFPAGLVLWMAARVLGPRVNRGLGPGMATGWLDHNVAAVLSRLLPTMSNEPLSGWSSVRDFERPALLDLS
ncbi:MAG: hypothetical protein R2707_09000 [Acidimicrobiales bacterium]